MKINPLALPVFSANNRKPKIDPKPQYQRGAVWSEHNKQLLIDSILRGYDIPKIFFRVKESGAFEHEVVDGQQRLRAIWEFLENKYSLGEESKDFGDLPDLDGKYFQDLDSNQQDRILAFTLTITEIRDATENEIRELFLRLQEGKSLSPPEKRNAMLGKMRDFVAQLAEHKVFKVLRMKNDRFQHDDLVAHVTCLELAGGAANVKATDLKKMYENEISFDETSGVAKKGKRVLNYMSVVLNSSPPEMNIKWGFVDLYLLISKLLDGYKISGREEDFCSFFVGFERERRAVADPADLLSGVVSPWDRDLYDYIDAFQKEGAKRESIEKRHVVYKRRFLNEYQDLVPKDAKRGFSEDERIVIWRRAGMKCELCGVEIAEFSKMHADHKIPHSVGGKTILANAQCLCLKCNLAKGAS